MKTKKREIFCTFAADFGKRRMKRHRIYCKDGFLGVFFVVWLTACQSSTRWNNLEFYNVEKLEQLSEKPVATDDEDTVGFGQLHEQKNREMDVKVDMQFMTSENDANERVCRLINSHLVELLLNQSSEMDVDEAVAQYIEDVKAEFHSDEVTEVYYDHLTGRAEYGMENIINYRLKEEVFTGGAHPCTITTILRFNAMTGEFIALDNIFLNQERLKELLLARLMENQQVKTLDELRKKGFLEMTDFFVSSNFALREDSIEFHYNEYDIAPYAYGASTICLSYEEAQEVMAGTSQTVNP